MWSCEVRKANEIHEETLCHLLFVPEYLICDSFNGLRHSWSVSLPTNECTSVDGLNDSINESQLKIYQHVQFPLPLQRLVSTPVLVQVRTLFSPRLCSFSCSFILSFQISHGGGHFGRQRSQLDSMYDAEAKRLNTYGARIKARVP